MRIAVVVALVAASLVAALTRAAAAPTGAAVCTGEGVRATLTSFVSAFNRGDLAALDALFASAPDFQWYSSNPPGLRNNDASKQRGTLLSYFRGRHAKNDKLRLVSLRFNGNWGSNGNIDFRMKRSASDYASGQWFTILGKAAIRCEEGTGKFAVLSMGGDQSCPITAAGRATGGFGASGFNYGTSNLRAHLGWWRTGELPAGVLPDGGSFATVAGDGSIHAKVGWWRGRPGNVQITIRRYNNTGPSTRTRGPNGYGETGFQPSILTFPTTGCWRVTGKVGRSQISFVVRVSKVGS